MTAKVDVPPADPRRKRGRRHPLAGLLAVGIAAVTAGSRSLAAIGQWAADAGPDVLAGLGAARTGAAWTLRTAAARCARDQARYLGGRPPYVTGRPMPGAPGQDAPRARPQPRRM
jgi:DDE_Tnp_1-associated